MNLSIYSLQKIFYLILVLLALTVILAVWPLNDHNNEIHIRQKYLQKFTQKRENQSKQEHRLAVLVPYRNRFKQLLRFVPHMSRFLQEQNISNKVYILHQTDSHRFNRAALINVGHLISKKEGFDYMAMHDVDLLPLNQELVYHYPGQTALHLAGSGLHPKYDYSKFVGGILLLSHEIFELVDGMSGKYWGWGLEDDEFYLRLQQHHIPIHRPVVLKSNKTNTFLHLHDKSEKRDTMKLFNQREITRRRDRQTGLHNVKYNLEARNQLQVNGFYCEVINIRLDCDRSLTPWCDTISTAKKSSI